jgi:purine-binding chemotaxis protein CheW
MKSDGYGMERGRVSGEIRSMPSEGEQKKILAARAKALSRQPEKEEPAAGRIEIVEFVLAQERYGIELSYIGEIYPLQDLTEIPCTPPFVLGVMNVRGNIISVIDMRKFFQLTDNGLSDLNKVIIVRNDTMEFGILADAILGVRWLSLARLLPSLPTLTDVRSDYLKGVTGDRLVVLDGGKILSDRGIVVHEDV